jgi:outer membrane receptor for ferrienterochelin and colicin
VILLVAAAHSAAAQSNPPAAAGPSTTSGEIRGRVLSADNKAPLGLATVEVTRFGATTSSTRAATAADGVFHLQGLQPGRYRVQIRALGYTPKEFRSVEIGSTSLTVDLGTVALVAAPLQLQSVQVTTQRQNIQLAPDRNTYVVRDMPTTRGGTALDVLRNVPSVDVDIDNIVSLRGNSGVIVQMNGRPSPLKPAQLGNFLGQLPADVVDKVEVIPNPSARDDPTGVAGIINIVLKQETDAGKSGGLTLSGATTQQANIGGNLGYQRGPLTFYGSYGFLRDRRPRTESIFRENTFQTPITYLDESATRLQLPLSHTLTGSTRYQLGEKDELSLDMMYSSRGEDQTYGISYRDLNAQHVITGLSDRLTTGENNEFNSESTLGYKHAFAEKGHKLSSELRIFRQGEGGPSDVAAHTLTLTGAPIGSPTLEKQTTRERPGENSLKLDYTRPLSSDVRLETGYKGSLQQFRTTLYTQVFDNARAAYFPDSSRISDFTYDQLVNAAYAMLSAQTGKFQLQGGVRIERATTKFHLKTLGVTYDNGYNSIFPSALVAYNIDDSHEVKLSYSTRIKRPDDTDLLDPTAHYADPLNLSRGNPYLKPEYIRALELGLQRTGERMTLQLTPFFRRTLDAVRTIRNIDSAGIATRTFANIATSDSYGSDATVALSGGRLTGFMGASAFRQVSDAANLAPGLSVSTFGWRARTNASYRFSKTFDLQTLFSYQAAMDVEQGRNASRTQFSLAARQKLMDDQMSLTLRVIDPFNTSREGSTTIDPRFYQVSNRARAIRGLLLSVNLTFGKQDKQSREPIDPGNDTTPP